MARRRVKLVMNHAEYIAQHLWWQLVDAGEAIAEHARMTKSPEELLVDPFQLQGYIQSLTIESGAEAFGVAHHLLIQGRTRSTMTDHVTELDRSACTSFRYTPA